MTNKVYSFLGLATKAGKLVSGEDACEKAVKAGKVSLVIVAGDASENTKKNFRDACNYRGIELRFFGEKELLGRYTGKEIRAVVAITETGFTKKLLEMIDRKDLEYGGERIGES